MGAICNLLMSTTVGSPYSRPTRTLLSWNFSTITTILSTCRLCTAHPVASSLRAQQSQAVATTAYSDVNCRSRISSPIVDMSFAPNGRLLACFTEAIMLTVISISFETKVLDFVTSEGSNSPPLEMQWCGEDRVVLHWENLRVLMVRSYRDWLHFPYYGGIENVFLLPVMDCCDEATCFGN